MVKTFKKLPSEAKYVVKMVSFNQEEGDFSLRKENDIIEMQINTDNNVMGSLSILSNYLIQHDEFNKPINLYIDKETLISVEQAIDLYLLSYQFLKKINFYIKTDSNEESIINEIKETLKNILFIKKDMCCGMSDVLEVQLECMYPILSPIAQLIVDRTYKEKSNKKLDLKGKKAIIIDNHNFFYRNYHGMPDMRDSKNRPTALIKALTTLIKSIETKKPDFVIFANEGTRKVNIRKDIFPDYKKSRNEPHDDLKSQIDISLDLLKEMNINIVSVEGYEADDIIASYSKTLSEEGCSVEVITTDKDLYQILAGDNLISIYNPSKQEYITEQHCLEKFGVTFDKCLMVQAIIGDTSDDIPGIKGIGMKTAAPLVNQYLDLENLYKNKENLTGKKGEMIVNGEEDAFTSLKLVTLNNTLADLDVIYNSKMPEKPLLKIIDKLAEFDITIN